MQRNKMRRFAATTFAVFALVAALAMPAAAKITKPTVVIIKSELCAACQKLEPTMMELMKQYGDRLDFVVLDVSDDQKLAAATKTARKLGLRKFLNDNQQKTSTVAVFGKGNKLLFQTMMNFDREAYVKAFDEAVAQG